MTSFQARNPNWGLFTEWSGEKWELLCSPTHLMQIEA